MCRERIIIEFDDWTYNKDVDWIMTIEQAIKDGDFTTVAQNLHIYDADDIRIEEQKYSWEEK